MGLENEAWWGDLVAKKDTVSLRDLAAEFGTTPGAISLALKRTGTSRVPKGEALPPEPGEATRPGSKDAKIEPLLDLLGRVPDAEVAEKAGVSVRTIASYRSRNQISGYQGRSAPKKRRQRKSRIDPFQDLLGQVPDRVVAEKAGVTLNAVRNYRATRGIASSRARPSAAERVDIRRSPGDAGEGRRAPGDAGEGRRSQGDVGDDTRRPQVDAEVAESTRPRREAVVARGSRSEARSVPSGDWAWRLVFEDRTDRVVAAGTLTEAAALGASAGLGAVVSVERVGAML